MSEVSIVDWLTNFNEIIHSYCINADTCADCKWHMSNDPSVYGCRLLQIQNEIYEDSKPRTIIELTDPVDAGDDYPY